MIQFYTISLLSSLLLLTACSPVKSTASNQYQLTSFSAISTKHPAKRSILITVPEAVAGFQTEKMLYTDKPYELSAFANNAWISPPAEMLFPLMLQSVQKMNYFSAVTSSISANQTDYRLDTQLIELKQNFLKKPSELLFTCKIVLTHINDNRVVASQLISEKIPTRSNTPYGGVIAANEATTLFTAQLAQFLQRAIEHDRLG